MNTHRIAAFVLLASPVAAQLHVPGDYPDPQSAVNNASPGSVIIVHGGVWTATSGPALTIDRPLTLIGDPAPTFEPAASGSGQQPPTVLLAGPGSGSVVLANVRVLGQALGFLWSSQTGGVVGGGFDELLVHDSDLRAPEWVAMSGIGTGTSGIDVTLPFLLISGSSVRASDHRDDGCYGFALAGRPGVDSSGTVVVLDSTVLGGTYLNPCFPFPGCAPLPGGDGGPGVVAVRVDEAGSTITGGPGASWRDVLGVPCGSAAVGPSVSATTHVVLASDLTVSRPTRIGSSLTLSWNTPGPVIQLFYSRGSSAPYSITPGLGDAYLRPVGVRMLGTFPSGSGLQSLTIPVPPSQALLGLAFTFQGFDGPDHVTRPVAFALGH